jgi:hypothetical protein
VLHLFDYETLRLPDFLIKGYMAIPYQGKITPSDVRKAIFRNYSRFRFAFSAVLIGAALVWMVYSIIKFPYVGSETLFWAAVLIVASMDLWLPFLYSLRTNRAGSAYRLPIHGSADENGITLENGEIKVEYAWGDFTQYKISDAMALLYRGKRGMNIFTLGLFASPQEWQNFKDLVEARISKGIK